MTGLLRKKKCMDYFELGLLLLVVVVVVVGVGGVCFFSQGILQKYKKTIPVVLFSIIPCARLWSASISLQESICSDLVFGSKDQHSLLYFLMNQIFSLSLARCLYEVNNARNATGRMLLQLSNLVIPHQNTQIVAWNSCSPLPLGCCYHGSVSSVGSLANRYLQDRSEETCNKSGVRVSTNG